MKTYMQKTIDVQDTLTQHDMRVQQALRILAVIGALTVLLLGVVYI